MIGGLGLLAVPGLYAVVMGWLRGGYLLPPAPLSCEEGGAGYAQELPADSEVSLRSATGAPSPQERGAGGEVTPTFSLLIAARNEAAALPLLLADLAAQAFPAARFEVLLADDHSTDATAALVRAAAVTVPFTLHLITLPPTATGKKAALAAALARARAPWLVCTDADCRLGPGWLAAYAGFIQQHPTANFISGPVLLTGPPTLFMGLMGLEFAGLVGVGAACLGRRQPTMCNGANLAYRRTAFEAVGGYFDNQHLASGDDEFLLHKVHAAFPGTAHFLTSRAALARTAAPPTLGALLRQRVRWASKWRHYQSPASRYLALLVLGANVSLTVGLGVALARPSFWPWAAAAWVIKLAADAWLLGPVLAFLRRRRWLGLLLPLQLLYAPYALAVGLAGWRGGYQWKGRAVQN